MHCNPISAPPPQKKAGVGDGGQKDWKKIYWGGSLNFDFRGYMYYRGGGQGVLG